MAVCNKKSNSNPFGDREPIGEIMPNGRANVNSISDPILRKTVMNLDENIFKTSRKLKDLLDIINPFIPFLPNIKPPTEPEEPPEEPDDSDDDVPGGGESGEEVHVPCATIATITGVNTDGYDFVYDNGETSSTAQFHTVNNYTVEYREYAVGDAILVHKVLVKKYTTT